MPKNTPKHIVIDARTRPSSTGRYVDRLMEHLQKIDKENTYTVLLLPNDDWRPIAKNFKTVVCKYKRFSFNPLDQITFAWFLHRLKPDMVHFGMTPQEPMFYFGTRVTTAHDLTMFSFTRPGRLPGWLHSVRMVGYRLTFWWSLRLAKQVIAPTKYVAADVGRKYGFAKHKTAVTYEASEPPLKVKAEAPDFIKKSEFILHVGSPFPHKNIDSLVEAYEILKDKHPDLKLVLAGKKEQYFERLEQSIQTSLVKDDIIIPGFVPDTELKWLYENAEAYVLPSLSEGFGLPGLEAMAHGCPVVSSNATCLPEVYGDSVIYFDPNNTNDMAEKIHDVLSDKSLRQSLVKNGYKQLKKYSWRRMAEQTLKIYKSVLK